MAPCFLMRGWNMYLLLNNLLYWLLPKTIIILKFKRRNSLVIYRPVSFSEGSWFLNLLFCWRLGSGHGFILIHCLLWLRIKAVAFPVLNNFTTSLCCRCVSDVVEGPRSQLLSDNVVGRITKIRLFNCRAISLLSLLSDF